MGNGKKKFLKYLGAFMALVMVAVISITGTLAYLQTRTAARQNTFTGSGDISLQVVEEDWDGEGSAKAAQYTPGLVIPKDPALKNTTGTNYSEWVAIRVDYYQGSPSSAVSYTDFAKQMGEDANTSKVIEGITFNTTDWFDITPPAVNYQVYAYKIPLEQNITTNTLFDEVQINEKLVRDGSGSYPAFHIYISGAAIKVETAHNGITDLSATSDENTNIKNALLAELAQVSITP